ncbi:MAG TPA: DUF6152 family protein [Vicinamibacterales bacterium]|nr:DUF6152 family protein [Vicinamibacterales bacterium]
MITTRYTRLAGALSVIAAGAMMVTPALSHHSFAMYNMTVTKVMTGKLTRFIPGSNHAQLIFEVLNPDGTPVIENGKPLVWGMETGSAAAMARNGVTVESFPPGTIMTVTLHPLRDGRPMGAVGGPIVHCGTHMPTGGCNEKTGKVLGAPAN